MKRQLIILAVSVLAIPSMAQSSNGFGHGQGERRRPEWNEGERPDRQYKQGRPEMSPEKKAKMQERRLQLMEKSLREIGISEEQRVRIFELQKRHREKMKAVSQQAGEARAKLSRLQDVGASEAELDVAIDAVSDAQSAQLKILVRNRMEMEQILGKEKYVRFMESARMQFRSHGRRGGSGMPPRPDLPPLPGGGQNSGIPPLPDAPQNQKAPRFRLHSKAG